MIFRNFFKDRHSYFNDIVISIILILVLIFNFLKTFPDQINFFLLVFFSIIGVIPIIISAINSFKEGEWASMDMLASIALIFSMLSGEWPSAIFITLMITSARILDKFNEEKAEKSITGLLKLRPETAKIKIGDSIKIIPVDEIKIGDIVLVDLSERIPVDGSIIFGQATVDESSLTGESLPVEKDIGKQVSSSTLVVSGSILIQTEKIGKDTTLEKIIALVQNAREEKPEIQEIGAVFGKIYLLSVFFGSIIIFLFTQNIHFVLAVVLVVCADDIAVAIPIAYLRAISISAKAGIIIKGGKHLEILRNIDFVVFDKTGTLTSGKLSIADVQVIDDYDLNNFLENVLMLTKRSSHPLSKAFVSYAQTKKVKEIPAESVEIIGGRGIIAKKDNQEILLGSSVFLENHKIIIPKILQEKATAKSQSGESISYLAVAGKTVGFFSALNKEKENAHEVIKKISKLDVKEIIMLTGDNQLVASSIANKIGITKFYADLLPQDKVQKIRDLQKIGKVAMVGDGVNDAAALSIANVGIAMGALGSDGAIESAEIILMKDNLADIPKIIKMARKVHQIAIHDFYIWGIVNAIGLFLVFGGVLNSTGAAAYNFLSDFIPLLNSLRAKIK